MYKLAIEACLIVGGSPIRVEEGGSVIHRSYITRMDFRDITASVVHITRLCFSLRAYTTLGGPPLESEVGGGKSFCLASFMFFSRIFFLPG